MGKRLQVEKYIILFAIGGMAYFFLEVLVRGYSHYTMFLCGGACFVCCGLLNENKKIGDIALELGYSNASKFSKAFQSVYGVLPKDYRKKK